MSILDEIHRLAKTVDLTPEEIKAEIGLSFRWYQKVLSGDIPNPGVTHVEKLHRLLLSKIPRKTA